MGSASARFVAVVAVVAAVAMAAGCSGGAAVRPVAAASLTPPSNPTNLLPKLPIGAKPHVVPESACVSAQLRFRFGGLAFGAGNDFGGITISDVGHRSCELLVRGSIRPIFAATSPVATDRRFDPTRLHVEHSGAKVLLTAPHARPRQRLEISMYADYRDGPGPRGLCPKAHEFVPLVWRIRIGSIRRTVSNGSHPGQAKAIFDGADPGEDAGGVASVETCGGPFVVVTQPGP